MALTKDNKDLENKDAEYIDIANLVKVMWQKKWILLISAIAGAALVFTYTISFITPLYQASIMFYVNNSNISIGSTAISISASDLTAAQSLVDTYIEILKTPETMDEIIDVTDTPYTSAQLSGMVSAGAMNSTEIFKITVTGESPEEILKISNKIGTVLPKRIAKIVEGSDVRIVNHAEVVNERVSPSYTKNTAIGFLAGLMLCAAVIVFKELSNNTVRSEEYLNRVYDIPILALVPNMSSNRTKSNYQRHVGKTTTEVRGNETEKN